MNQFNSSNGITKGRKWKVLQEKERYNIEMLLKEKYKVKEIALALNRDRRTMDKGNKKRNGDKKNRKSSL